MHSKRLTQVLYFNTPHLYNPALPGILTPKQKKSRPRLLSWPATPVAIHEGRPSRGKTPFHISIKPSTLNHRQDSDSDAALPRQIHPICHKFRLSTKFTRDALTGRPLRYRIEAMKIISRPLFTGGRPQKHCLRPCAYGLPRGKPAREILVLCQVWVQVKLRFLSISYPAIKAAFFL